MRRVGEIPRAKSTAGCRWCDGGVRLEFGPMTSQRAARRVLLLEFNEITRTIIDPMMKKGRLPAFARLFEEGALAAPESVDQSPHLDPWVTWVTLHTGVDRSVHGATVLEQDSATI